MTAMENLQKRLKLGYETKTMEDLPVEIILKIFDFVNIRDLFQCMAVNKKIREIANDQSLWNKMHIDGVNFKADLPAQLLSKILAKGCQYLSLFNCKIVNKGTIKFATNIQLRYLSVDRSNANYDFDEDDVDEFSFNVLPDFAASCHILEKLSIKRLDYLWVDPEITQNELKFFKCIIQNSNTLKTLNLKETRLSFANVQLIFSQCQDLFELNIAAECSHDHESGPPASTELCPESVDYICNNLATTIEKLDISWQQNFEDDQCKTLIKRCTRITELSFGGTSVTNDSMNTIVETLYESQVKLRPGLFCHRRKLKLASHLSDKERRELRKRSPFMKHEYFDGGLGIAEPYPYIDTNEEEAGLVPNRFWDIKAKLRTYN